MCIDLWYSTDKTEKKKIFLCEIISTSYAYIYAIYPLHLHLHQPCSTWFDIDVAAQCSWGLFFPSQLSYLLKGVS